VAGLTCFLLILLPRSGRFLLFKFCQVFMVVILLKLKFNVSIWVIVVHLRKNQLVLLILARGELRVLTNDGPLRFYDLVCKGLII
jgi:hypothetical protein